MLPRRAPFAAIALVCACGRAERPPAPPDPSDVPPAHRAEPPTGAGDSDASAPADDASADAADEADAPFDAPAGDARDAEGGADDGAPPVDAGGDADPDATPDGGACHAVEQSFAPDPGAHVADCTWIAYSTNPPNSGTHYPYWSAFRAYDAPLPRGYWVHDLEHGAVVVTYRCPGGCDAEVAAAQAWIDALPLDPLCGDAGPPLRRTVLTPDPHLDVRWAASAWGFTLRADCFDPAAFGAFYAAHVGHAPEDFCAQGVDFSGPDGGGVVVAPGCGEPPADAGAD